MLDLKQEHIDNGKPKGGGFCALALAFVDAGFPGGCVYPTGFYAGGYINGPTAGHTQATYDFMLRFDAGKPVKPHRFRIPGLVRP